MASFILRHVRYSSSTPRLPDMVLDGTPAVVVRDDFCARVDSASGGALITMQTGHAFLNGARCEACVVGVGDEVAFGSDVAAGDGTYNAYRYRLEAAGPSRPAAADTLGIEAKHHDYLRKTLACAICAKPLLLPHVLVCGHSACGDCLADALADLRVPPGGDKKRPFCNTCNRECVSSQTAQDLCMTKLIQEMMDPYLSAEESEWRAARVAIWYNRKTMLARRNKRLKELAAAAARTSEERESEEKKQVAPVTFEDMSACALRPPPNVE